MSDFNDRTADESMIALKFYKEIVQALRSTGVKQILVCISKDGKLCAEITEIKKSPCGHKGQT